jgi:nucleoside-diphosphate-sugar epimerase
MSSIVLVTGGSGFIGSHITEELCARGYHVRCFFRRSSSHQWINHLPVEIVYGTLDDTDSLLPAVKDADYIFHAAGVVKALHKKDFYINNFEGTEHLARVALKCIPRLKRLVFVSSQAAAGPAESIEYPRQPRDACKPFSDYGRSKVLAEECLTSLKDRLPVTIIRPPGVYGPRDTETLLFLKMVRSGLAVIPGLRTRYINLIYTKDLARGIVDAAESAAAENNIYFLTDGIQYTYQILFRQIGTAIGKRYLTVPLPSFMGYLPAMLSEIVAQLRKQPSQLTCQKMREAQQRFWICSSKSAEKDFGFTCRFNIQAGLAETVAWYRKQGWF